MFSEKVYKDLSLGQLLYQLRITAGLSREELGEKAGYQGATIGRWERDVADPSLRAFFRILTACDVPLEALQEDYNAVVDLLREYRQLSPARQELVATIVHNQLCIELGQHSYGRAKESGTQSSTHSTLRTDSDAVGT